MMIGVAQVIGMKPTLRSVFSSAGRRLREGLGRRAAAGRRCEIAASAVAAPTAFRKARRAASSGKSARITAASTTPS